MEKAEKPSVTESQLDDIAEKRFNGDYQRAYDYLGVSPEDVVLESQSKPETSPKIGPCVNLGERAIHLSKALDSYAQSSRLKGFNEVSSLDEKINKRYSPVAIAAIGSAQDSTRWAGDNEFAKAFGVDVMAEAGMEPGYARAISQINAGKFFDEYTGPDNRKKLAKYRKILKK
jgi:hypothetical protein